MCHFHPPLPNTLIFHTPLSFFMETPTNQLKVFEGRLVYSVFSITRRIREDLEGDEDLVDIWVEGEITGYKFHSPSGHHYFSLKDDNAQIRCACFRNAAGGIQSIKMVKDGDKVLVRGDVSIYEARGQYNIRVRDLKLIGKGELYLLYEKMKKQLEAEGLFDPKHKKKIPAFPQTIGVVTSETGAAFQDILNVLKRRYPLAKILLAPAKVQGEGAAKEIAEGIKALDESGLPDVIIAGRGGGSMEDLWCFNEEIVARAIYNCQTPIISAVGHEIDFTIADHTADLRAPTPSAAAELVAPSRADIENTINEWDKRLDANAYGLLESKRDVLETLEERLESRSPRTILEQGQTRCDELEERLDNAIKTLVAGLGRDIVGWEERLDNAAVSSTLARGYVLARKENGVLAKGLGDIEEGEEITLIMKDGEAKARIKTKMKGDEKDG